MGSSSELDEEGGQRASLRLGETFELVVDGSPVAVRSEVARRVLTVLAQRADEMVPHDALVDAVWDADSRPPGAVRALQGHVSRLRRLLGSASGGIVTERGGYRLRRDVIAVHLDRGRPAPVAVEHDLIGRDAEIDAVAALMGQGRIVTLTGPGGIGKTALGQAAIDRYMSVTGIPNASAALTSAITAGDVPVAVARALGIERPGGEDWIERLVEALGGRPLALLVDGADHVPDAAGDLVAALAGQAELAVLVTCRAALGVTGEITHHVTPLDPEQAAPALFSRAATVVRPDWEPTAGATTTVGEICAAVGLRPLGIELAAAQLRSRSIDEVAASLSRAREPLDGVRPVGAPDDGLRAIFESAAELLDGRRRSSFDQFAVFVAGATAETASRVCFPARTRTPTATRQLDDLADRALLGRTPTALAPRYSMLDSIRHHSLERLVAGRELRGARLRHAEALLRFVEEAASSMWGPDESAWVAQLDSERADICLAHHTFERLGEHVSALRLATAAYTCVWPRSWTDLCGLIDVSIEHAAGVPALVAGPALAAAADRANMAGDVGLARQRAERSLAVVDDQRTQLAHGVLGDAALYAGDVDEAVSRWRRAAAGFEATTPGLAPYAAASAALALVYGGHADEAARVADLALVAADASACPTSGAFARYVAATAHGTAAPERARALLDEAVATATPVRSAFIANLARTSAAALDQVAGEVEAALASYPLILREWLRLGAWPRLWEALRAMVPLLAAAGGGEEAATVLGGLGAYAQDAGAVVDGVAGAHPELEQRGAELTRPELVLYAELAAGTHGGP